MLNVKWNYNEVRMFSIESVKKTKVTSGYQNVISKLEKSLVNYNIYKLYYTVYYVVLDINIYYCNE